MESKNVVPLSWPIINSCEQCTNSGLNKIFSYFFKNGLDCMSNMDFLLLYSFVITFIGFIVAVAFSFAEPNQMILMTLLVFVKQLNVHIKKIPSVAQKYTCILQEKARNFFEARKNFIKPLKKKK